MKEIQNILKKSTSFPAAKKRFWQPLLTLSVRVIAVREREC